VWLHVFLTVPADTIQSVACRTEVRDKYNLLEGPCSDCCIHCCCCTACAGALPCCAPLGVQLLAMTERYDCLITHVSAPALQAFMVVAAVCQEGMELKTRAKMPPVVPTAPRIPSNLKRYPQVQH
jgi:hypothetical protein